mmetsp:Transcript_9127/g.25472  ORF Transcript_9127/g.25472 Transcript_9127/m.25472 type:complete len:283 (+) Transcript_9127:553-1401(+)
MREAWCLPSSAHLRFRGVPPQPRRHTRNACEVHRRARVHGQHPTARLLSEKDHLAPQRELRHEASVTDATKEVRELLIKIREEWVRSDVWPSTLPQEILLELHRQIVQEPRLAVHQHILIVLDAFQVDPDLVGQRRRNSIHSKIQSHRGHDLCPRLCEFRHVKHGFCDATDDDSHQDHSQKSADQSREHHFHSGAPLVQVGPSVDLRQAPSCGSCIPKSKATPLIKVWQILCVRTTRTVTIVTDPTASAGATNPKPEARYHVNHHREKSHDFRQVHGHDEEL